MTLLWMSLARLGSIFDNDDDQTPLPVFSVKYSSKDGPYTLLIAQNAEHTIYLGDELANRTSPYTIGNKAVCHYISYHYGRQKPTQVKFYVPVWTDPAQYGNHPQYLGGSEYVCACPLYTLTINDTGERSSLDPAECMVYFEVEVVTAYLKNINKTADNYLLIKSLVKNLSLMYPDPAQNVTQPTTKAISINSAERMNRPEKTTPFSC